MLMATVSFASSLAPFAIPAGMPSLVTDDVVASLTEYDLANLTAIYVYLNITPPTEGSGKLDVWFGPSNEPDVEDLTGLHNSFQGGLSLAGITYPTDRQVYSLPLSSWFSVIANPFTWRLSIYNWSDVDAGVLNNWWVSYVFGASVLPPAIPLNPLARNLGHYYGVGSSVRKDISYTLKEMTLDGVVGFVMPVLAGTTNLCSAIYSIRNYEAGDVTTSLELIRVRGNTSTVAWTGTVVVPTGFSTRGWGSFIF
jgi:hypothetical protein